MQSHILKLDSRFCFEAGGCLDGAELLYHTSDRSYRPSERVVWICHALTGNSNPEDWWPGMVGAGQLIDPEKDFVVCVSMLCSPYGKCGPAAIQKGNSAEAGQRPYLMQFPKTTVRDMVNACIEVRKVLGISKIDLLIGPSIGGFQAVEWAVMEPDVIANAAFIATDVRVSPFMTAFNESQRMALLADPTFLACASASESGAFDGNALDGGREGLKCARSIALISYRTNDGYNITQTETDDDCLFADRAASYQRYQGKKLIDRDFDAYSYWYLTYALDSMNVGRGRGGVASALSCIKAKCLIISITSDMLFPPSRGKSAASMISNASYAEIESEFGHDGFLIENDTLKKVLQACFPELLTLA